MDLICQVRLIRRIDFVGARLIKFSNFNVRRFHELVNAFIEVVMFWVHRQPFAVKDLSYWLVVSFVRRSFYRRQVCLGALIISLFDVAVLAEGDGAGLCNHLLFP